MKIFIVSFLFSVLCFGAYKTASQTLYLQNFGESTQSDVVATAQNLTTEWANLGTATNIDVRGRSSIGIWVDLDINDSANARVRALARHTTGGATYLLPIKTISSSAINVQSEYVEFTSDSDQKMLVSWDLDRIINYIDFQVQVSSTGTTAAQIDDARITKGWK